jgi:hypothetical protein
LSKASLEIGGFEPPTEARRLYLPFPAAAAADIVDPEIAQPLPASPGNVIHSGELPNYWAAGLARKGQQPFGVFDLVHLDEGIIYPTSKKAVSKDGRFQGEGTLIFMTFDLVDIMDYNEGVLRKVVKPKLVLVVAEMILRSKETKWKEHDYSTRKLFGRVAMAEGPDLGIFRETPLDQLPRRVVETDPVSGIIVTV